MYQNIESFASLLLSVIQFSLYIYTYNEVKSINLTSVYKVISEYVAVSRVMFSFAGVLVHMYFSVSAPSAQHGLHLFGFSHVLLIFKTSCWLI